MKTLMDCACKASAQSVGFWVAIAVLEGSAVAVMTPPFVVSLWDAEYFKNYEDYLVALFGTLVPLIGLVGVTAWGFRVARQREAERYGLEQAAEERNRQERAIKRIVALRTWLAQVEVNSGGIEAFVKDKSPSPKSLAYKVMGLVPMTDEMSAVGQTISELPADIIIDLQTILSLLTNIRSMVDPVAISATYSPNNDDAKEIVSHIAVVLETTHSLDKLLGEHLVKCSEAFREAGGDRARLWSDIREK